MGRKVLLSRLGLRAGEVAGLQLDDVEWRRGELLIRGKGGRHDVLPLPVDVGEALVSYLRRRPRCECRALFLRVTAPRRELNRSTIGWVVRAACDRAGLPRVGAHQLRHTAATEMLGAGASLAEIGQVLRQRVRRETATDEGRPARRRGRHPTVLRARRRRRVPPRRAECPAGERAVKTRRRGAGQHRCRRAAGHHPARQRQDQRSRTGGAAACGKRRQAASGA